MIKKLNKFNLICMIFCGILELMAIVGAYAANYFTRRRMGMLRHVVYLNGRWEKTVPISIIKWIALGIIIVLIILVFLHYLKEKVHPRVSVIVTLLTIGISLWTVYYLLFYDTTRSRAYYITSICFVIVTLFQNIICHCFLSIKATN